MDKGDMLRVTTVLNSLMPGCTLLVCVQDIRAGVVTAHGYGPGGGPSAVFVVRGSHLVFRVKQIVTGHPRVFQFVEDDAMMAAFSEDNLSPKFNRKTLRYEYGMPVPALDAWVEQSVLDRVPVDWHYACPDCDTMVTLRQGCYNCYAPRDKARKMLRHLPCGYIGPAKQFADWTCPGCKAALPRDRDEVEEVTGRMNCEACGYRELPTLVAGCLGCGKVFPLTEAVEMPVFKYRRTIPILTRTSGATF